MARHIRQHTAIGVYHPANPVLANFLFELNYKIIWLNYNRCFTFSLFEKHYTKEPSIVIYIKQGFYI